MAVLACPNHFNAFMDDFPERALLQCHKLPLDRENLYHCSHIINTKYSPVHGQQLLRDNVGDWYPTRAADAANQSNMLYSTAFFNTFRDVHRMTVHWLELYEAMMEVDALPKGLRRYIKRVNKDGYSKGVTVTACQDLAKQAAVAEPAKPASLELPGGMKRTRKGQYYADVLAEQDLGEGQANDKGVYGQQWERKLANARKMQRRIDEAMFHEALMQEAGGQQQQAQSAQS